MTYTATYSPEDNKLRLYSSTRLDREIYARVRGAGFIYAPKQELFVAPMWTPEREDLLIELRARLTTKTQAQLSGAFGKLVWPISAVCFGPPPGTLKVWEIFIPWSSRRWECGNRC
jgi:hypothetical protein